MFKLFKFYAVEGGGSAGVQNEELTKDDILDELNIVEEGDETEVLDLKPEKKEDEGKEDEEEEIDELEELENELEEPDPDKLELVTVPKRSTILKEFPTLFKKFPGIEHSIYRDKQYSEVFPTPNDAKEAVEKLEVMGQFETQLMSGKTEDVLKTVKETDENAFYKIVDDYLPTLARVDQAAYHHVIGNIIKNTIAHMASEAARLGLGENGQGVGLNAAATILHQYVFGSSEWKPPSNLSKETKPDPNEQRISERERGLLKQNFDLTRNELASGVDKTLRATIDRYLDPKESMSDYVRSKAAQDVLETVHSLIDRDKSFEKLLDKLWEQVFKSNFSSEAKSKVRSAYLSKAQTLLAAAIKKARNEALKGSAKNRSSSQTEEEDEEETTTVHNKRERSSAPVNRGRTTKDKAKQIPAGMSTLEFLNQD